MNRKQANNLMLDLRKSLKSSDFCEDLYLSFADKGTKQFKSCSYFYSDNWLFIWTKDESFVFDNRKVGDFVFIPTKDNVINLKKTPPCY